MAVSSGQVENIDKMVAFFQDFSIRMSEQPFEFQFNEYSKQWIMWGLFCWFLMVAALENSKRNYINGMEYGTARWGNS